MIWKLPFSGVVIKTNDNSIQMDGVMTYHLQDCQHLSNADKKILHLSQNEHSTGHLQKFFFPSYDR